MSTSVGSSYTLKLNDTFAHQMEEDLSEIYLNHSFYDSCGQNSLEGIVPEIQMGTFECSSDLTIVPFESCSSLGYMTAYAPNEFAGETCELLWADENCLPLLTLPPDFCLEDKNPHNHDGMDVADYGVWDIIHHTSDGDLANEFLADTQNFQADEIGPISCLEMFPSDGALDALNTLAEHPDMQNGDINNLQLACTPNFQDSIARSESCQYSSIVESAQDITLLQSIDIEAENSLYANGARLSTLPFGSEKEMIALDFFENSSSHENPLPAYSCEKKSESQLIQHQSHLSKYNQTAKSDEMECMSESSMPQHSQKPDDADSGKLVLYSDRQKKSFQRDASKELWVPMSEVSVNVGEEFPDAIEYCALLSKKGKSDRTEMRKTMVLNQKDMIVKAKLHLLFLGWKVEVKKDKDNHSDRYRFSSPGGTRYYSLSKACEAAIEQEQAQNWKQKGMRVKATSSHKSSSTVNLTSEDLGSAGIKPKYHPRAILNYLNYELSKKGPGKKSSSRVNNTAEQLGLNAAMHLLAVGWKLQDGQKPGGPHMRYISPRRKCFYSLRTACEALKKDQGMV